MFSKTDQRRYTLKAKTTAVNKILPVERKLEEITQQQLSELQPFLREFSPVGPDYYPGIYCIIRKSERATSEKASLIKLINTAVNAANSTLISVKDHQRVLDLALYDEVNQHTEYSLEIINALLDCGADPHFCRNPIDSSIYREEKYKSQQGITKSKDLIKIFDDFKKKQHQSDQALDQQMRHCAGSQKTPQHQVMRSLVPLPPDELEAQSDRCGLK